MKECKSSAISWTTQGDVNTSSTLVQCLLERFRWKDVAVCETVCSIKNRACAPRIRFFSPVLRIHYLRGHTTVIGYRPVARSWNTSCSICNQRQIESFVTVPAKRYEKQPALLTLGIRWTCAVSCKIGPLYCDEQGTGMPTVRQLELM